MIIAFKSVHKSFFIIIFLNLKKKNGEKDSKSRVFMEKPGLYPTLIIINIY